MKIFNKPQFLTSTLVVFLIIFVLSARPTYSLDPHDEVKLGREVFKKIEEHFGLLNIPEVSYYVTALGNKIVSAIPEPSYDYRFYVLDQEIPNAFTIPGGYVFINWGLFNILKSEGELASILAHELAHAQARHIHRQIATQKALAIASLAAAIAGAILGTNPQMSQALSAGAMASAQTVALKYSREHEREADQIGLHYLQGAGYSPFYAVLALKRLAERSWNVKPGVYDYLMTHPAIYERIDYMSLIVSSKSGKANSIHVEKSWFPYVKALVINRKKSTPGIRNLLAEWNSSAHIPIAAKDFARGLYYSDIGNLKMAEDFLASSWSKHPENPFIAIGLADLYFQEGKLNKSIEVLKTSVTENSDNPVVHYKYGVLLQEAGQNASALHHFMIAKNHSPLFPDLDYRIGTILGKQGHIGKAHAFLGDYYFRQHNVSLAKFHYKKALTLLNDPLLKKKIEKRLKNMHSD